MLFEQFKERSLWNWERFAVEGEVERGHCEVADHWNSILTAVNCQNDELVLEAISAQSRTPRKSLRRCEQLNIGWSRLDGFDIGCWWIEIESRTGDFRLPAVSSPTEDWSSFIFSFSLIV
jgi:hypothetical protein